MRNHTKMHLFDYTAHMTPNNIKPLYLIINNTKGYIKKVMKINI